MATRFREPLASLAKLAFCLIGTCPVTKKRDRGLRIKDGLLSRYSREDLCLGSWAESRLSISRPLCLTIADLGQRALATRRTFPPPDGPCGAEHSFSLVSAVTDQMADAAAPYSGENMFEIEVRLLRHLQANLPEMIRCTQEAVLMDQLDTMSAGSA